MKTQIFSSAVSLKGSLLLLMVSILFSTACEKQAIRPPDKPERSPIQLGDYKIQDVYKGRERTYIMGIHRVQDRFEFCNFANLRVNVNISVSETGKISILPQQVNTGYPEYLDIEIFEGTGIQKAGALEIVFWAREGKKEFRHEMRAVFLN